MKFDKHDILQLCELAVEAAKKAGKFISKQSIDSLIVEKKTGGDSEASQVVTEVDRKAEEMILKVLEPSLNKYRLGLLTEESEDDNSRFEHDYFWCIDPLDGTLPFIESSPGYSVSIGLVSQNGKSILGIVYDPLARKLYKAIAGNGAYLNGISTKIRQEFEQSRLTLLADRSFTKLVNYEQIVESVRTIAQNQGYRELDLITHGGGALNACWILEHAPAVYFKFPKATPGGGSLWDYAASACIIKEAGGYVSDIYGKALDLNRADSSFMNHKGILYASHPSLARAIIALHDEMVVQE